MAAERERRPTCSGRLHVAGEKRKSVACSLCLYHMGSDDPAAEVRTATPGARPKVTNVQNSGVRMLLAELFAQLLLCFSMHLYVLCIRRYGRTPMFFYQCQAICICI